MLRRWMATGAKESPRCLIVDDHPVVRAGVRAVLEKAFSGSEISDASSLEEAALGLNGEPPDVVIVDPWRVGVDVGEADPEAGQGQGLRDAAAHRVARRMGALNPEVGAELLDGVGQPVDVDLATGGRRRPEPGQVQGDDVEALGEQVQHRRPDLPPAADSVDQDEGLTAAAAVVVDRRSHAASLAGRIS
jgi:DNA-binding NarL/FixJ family response regulator